MIKYDFKNWSTSIPGEDTLIYLNQILGMDVEGSINHWGREVRFLKSHDFSNNCVVYVLKHSEVVIGFSRIRFEVDDDYCVITIYILPQFRKSSKSIQAIVFLFKFLIEGLKQRRIEFFGVKSNANISFYRRMFPLEGIRKKAFCFHGQYYDVEFFAVMKDEFPQWYKQWEKIMDRQCT